MHSCRYVSVHPHRHVRSLLRAVLMAESQCEDTQTEEQTDTDIILPIKRDDTLRNWCIEFVSSLHACNVVCVRVFCVRVRVCVRVCVCDCVNFVRCMRMYSDALAVLAHVRILFVQGFVCEIVPHMHVLLLHVHVHVASWCVPILAHAFDQDANDQARSHARIWSGRFVVSPS
jgi:hypothetical protein